MQIECGDTTKFEIGVKGDLVATHHIKVTCPDKVELTGKNSGVTSEMTLTTDNNIWLASEINMDTFNNREVYVDWYDETPDEYTGNVTFNIELQEHVHNTMENFGLCSVGNCDFDMCNGIYDMQGNKLLDLNADVLNPSTTSIKSFIQSNYDINKEATTNGICVDITYYEGELGASPRQLENMQGVKGLRVNTSKTTGANRNGGPFCDAHSIEWVYVGNNVNTLGDYFIRSDNLKKAYISKSVQAIVGSALNQCDNLKDIYYEGTEAEWHSITGYANIPKGATVHYNVSLE